MISQVIVTILQSGLRKDGSGRNNGGGGWRHDNRKDLMGGVVGVVVEVGGKAKDGGKTTKGDN